MNYYLVDVHYTVDGTPRTAHRSYSARTPLQAKVFVLLDFKAERDMNRVTITGADVR